MDIFDLVKFAPPADPLSQTTRTERRLLLATDLVAIALTIGGQVPSDISNLGVSLTTKQQNGLLSVVFLVVLYFLAAFLIYGVPEWRQFQADDQLFRQRLADFVKPYAKSGRLAQADYDSLTELFVVTSYTKLASRSRAERDLRAIFEFVVPVVVSIWSIVLLLGAMLNRPPSVWSEPNPGVFAIYVTFLALAVWGGVLWRRHRKEQSLTRAMRKISDEIGKVSERMRRAAQYPEGSSERGKARKEIEEDLQHLWTVDETHNLPIERTAKPPLIG